MGFLALLVRGERRTIVRVGFEVRFIFSYDDALLLLQVPTYTKYASRCLILTRGITSLHKWVFSKIRELWGIFFSPTFLFLFYF
jgi:hypothetical protein